MTWLVKERVNLPVFNEQGFVDGSVSKQPGETVTKAELKAAHQSDDDVASLVASGAIEEAS